MLTGALVSLNHARMDGVLQVNASDVTVTVLLWGRSMGKVVVCLAPP